MCVHVSVCVLCPCVLYVHVCFFVRVPIVVINTVTQKLLGEGRVSFAYTSASKKPGWELKVM